MRTTICILMLSMLGARAATNIAVFFSPTGGCTDAVVRELLAATNTIYVQAYGFTSDKIVDAVIAAKQRGVDVGVVLDKSDVIANYSSADRVKAAGLLTLIDRKHAIAHNKIMVIDSATVLTGSFNFTKSAQERNAENGMLIRGDAAVVTAYTDNWNKRYRQSRAY